MVEIDGDISFEALKISLDTAAPDCMSLPDKLKAKAQLPCNTTVQFARLEKPQDKADAAKKWVLSSR